MRKFFFLLPFWYPVKVMDYFVKNPTKIDFFAKPYVAYQSNQTVTVHTDICPHQGASLSKGWVGGEGNLHCPYHGFEFCSGRFCKIPNPRDANVKSFQNGYSMQTFPNRFEKNMLYICDPEVEPFAEVFYPPEESDKNFISVDGFVRFPSNYLQVIENLLDMLHISYVHSFGSTKTPLPNISKFEYVSPYHGRSTFTYQPHENSISQRVGNVKTVKVENEFILPTNTITRVTAGNTIKTVFTRCIPVSETETILYWKLYRNFWKNVFGDYLIRHLMKKTLKEDSSILRHVYPAEQVEQKIRTKYDRTIQEFRQAVKTFKEKN